ncbi:hypothetical protein C2W64_04527 [Brevibacillus laterosporus]|nr:hypothetical protein C2W64_04527 [Brevibacillus laterosporus]
MYGTFYIWSSEVRTLNAEAFVKRTMPLIINGAKKWFG